MISGNDKKDLMLSKEVTYFFAATDTRISTNFFI